LQRARELDPTYITPLFNLGNVFMALGQDDIVPLGALYLYAAAWDKQNRPEEAFAAYAKANLVRQEKPDGLGVDPLLFQKKICRCLELNCGMKI